MFCRVFGELGSVDTVVVRPFHTFGPGMRLDDSRVFGDFIAAIMRGKELIVRSGPTTNRTFCYAPEAAVGFLMATAGGANGDVFNIAGQAPTSIGALAEILTLEFLPAGSTVKYLNPTDSHRETNPVHEHSPDTSRIRALGWVSPTDALGAFRRTIEYLRRIEIGPLQSPLNE